MGSGDAAVGAESFDTGEDGGGGFAGDGLVGDGFEKSFVGRLRGFDLELERDGFFDQALQVLVAFSEMLGGFVEIKCRDGGCLCHDGSIPETGE